jgi:uncharacterized delta-60 repeat protein
VASNTPADDHTPSPPGQAGGSGGKPSGGSIVPGPPGSINDDNGATATNGFVQSETTLVAFGNTVVVGYNDSGSYNMTSGKFTGFSRGSINASGIASFTDGGQLPTNAKGDAGDPVMARNESSGRIYFATLQWSGGGINVYRSDGGGGTWQAPVEGAPGSGSSDKEWMAVDNNAGGGQGTVYLLIRDFSSAKNGIYLYKSTDNGSTFGPSGGTLIASAGSGNVQGPFVTIGPDHAVYVFYFDNSTTTEYIKVRKSTDQGATFSDPVTVATLATKGTNGDLGLSGIRNGTTGAAGFRSSAFPHAAVNPSNGQLYVTYDDRGTKPGDKADVYFTMSNDGGATWYDGVDPNHTTKAVRVNSDATTTDQWQPTIAASTDGRRVGVFYYSRQEDSTGNNLFKYYGSLGAVAGSTVTFGTNFAVSDTASKPEFGRDSLVNGSYMGDYNQAIATEDGYFNVTWSDNRSALTTDTTGVRMDPNVYFQKISNGLAVSSITPANGDVTTDHPTQYIVNFLDPVNKPDPSVFTVNSQPATDVTMSNDNRTATFTFPSPGPATTLGTKTMAIAAGAITRQGDGNLIQAFSASFQVTSLVVNTAMATQATQRTINYVVTFNDTLKTGTVDASDLSLSSGRVVGATQSGNQATYTIGYLPANGTLSVILGAGAVKDNSDNPNTAYPGSYPFDFGTSGGAPDAGFGSGGTVNIANAGALDGNGGVAVDPSTGKIVTGQGYASGGRNVFAVFRYNSDGGPDTSFGGTGVAFTPVGVGDALVSGVALQSDGKILVTGWAVASTKLLTDYAFATARFNDNGTLDTTFGSGGIVITNIKTATGNSPAEDRATAVAVQADGRIVVAGFSEQGANIYTEDFAVVRYNPNGSLDSTFGSGGIAVTPNFGGGQDIANGLAIQSDGRIVVAGQVTPSNGTAPLMAVARYTTGGQLDTTFNSTGTTRGIVTMAPTNSTNAGLIGVVVQGTNIVVSGWCTLGSQDLTLARLTTGGQLDPTFGGAGKGYAVSTDMAIGRSLIQANGKLYTSGRVDPAELPSSGSIDLGVAAFTADGAADTTFGTAGVVALDYGGTDDRGRALAAQGDGKIVVTGISNPGGNHLLVRLNP